MVKFSDIIKVGGETGRSEKSEEQDGLFRLGNLKELRSSIDKKVSKEDFGEIKEIYSSFQNYIKEVRTSVVDDKPFEIDPALILIGKVINSPELLEKVYQLSPRLSCDEDHVISRPINTLVYALKIGQGMRYSHAQLLELGLAALLYDVGIFRIPESIIKKEGKLTDSELALMKNHTEIGRDILSAFKEDHPWLARAAGEHHERENGQGYPGGIKGDEICEHAKIVGVVDTYEAMIYDRPYRKAITQHVSVKELIGSKNLLFPPKIIKIFLEEISLFPVGSYVRLNSMVIGEVVETSKAYPLRPFVKLLLDGEGNRMSEEKIINLVEHPLLYVSKAARKEDFPSEG